MGIIFRNVMTKTDLYGNSMRRLHVGTSIPAWRPARGGPHPAAPTGSDFRHNFSKNYPQDLKDGLQRRPPQFSTICAKNQVLKINIDKVTVILRRKSPFLVNPPCIYTAVVLLEIIRILGARVRRCTAVLEYIYSCTIQLHLVLSIVVHFS